MKVTFSESHKDIDLAFLTTTATLNILETFLGKVIALPTLGFLKVFYKHSENFFANTTLRLWLSKK